MKPISAALESVTLSTSRPIAVRRSAIWPALASVSDEAAAASFPTEIEKFLKLIGLYCRLDDFGITPDDLAPILKHAMEFPDSQGNPVVPSEEDMRNIYLRSFRAA